MIKYIPFVALIVVFSCNAAKQEANPHTIFTANTENLVPEGIATNDNGEDIYVTSIEQRKIILIKKDGTHKDFISSGAHGFGKGLGIKVDEKNNLLWAVSNLEEGKDKIAMVHAFDLKTAELRHKLIVRDTANHFFNDLIPDGNGNAYITATFGGEVFFADTKNKKIEVLIKDTLTQFPNGIALKDGKLYIATYSHGLLSYDLSSKKLSTLAGYTTHAWAFNLDGLGFYGNKLYGVYNGDSTNANHGVIEYDLSKDGLSIENEKIILKGEPSYHEPTTLAVANKTLFVLANSNLKVYNENKESIKGVESKLTPVAVVVYKFE